MNALSNTPALATWLTAMVVAAALAGCGGGGDSASLNNDTPGIIPGAACTAAGILIPTVTASEPVNGNLLVTTSTGAIGDPKQVTATFNMAMNPATINSAAPGALPTFTIKNNTTAGSNVAGTVLLNAAGTIATFTTTAALPVNSSFTATITTFARSAAITNDALGCAVSWTFATTVIASAGQANVTLGRAAPFAVFAGNAATVALVLPGGPGVLGSLIEGNVGLNPAGACVNCAIPTTVTGVIENGTQTAIDAQADFFAAFADASTRATGLCTLANPTDMTAPQGACVGYVAPPGTGGVYLPGLYMSAVSIGFTVGGTVTLDARGDPDAVFIFQTGDSITTGVDSTVILLNQAKAKNVWWTAAQAATLSLNTIFKGTVIGDAGVTVGVGSTVLRPTQVEGRVFSKTAAATIGGFTTITVPQ